jgi:acyl transferase domain-containing protein/acyl carrier protein
MRESMTNEAVQGGIAIIGMACRMPGARNAVEFWANLRDGIQSFTHFSEAELRSSGIDPALIASPNYVRSRGIIGGADEFDASFFNITPREAELTDPQQRIFLECAWHALEDAGYVPEKDDSRIGVFGGVGTNWHLGQAAAAPLVKKYASGASVVISNDKDYVTTRVSYKLGLTGPSVNVQSACSTSLVATVLGIGSLRAYQADIVLAGGATIEIPEKSGYLHQEGGMESADGKCRPFDAAANGTVFSRGAGVLVLKRVEDAIRDRDHIYAVILGGAINNDGGDKIGFTAPSVSGQLELAIESLERAGVSADAIDFVEAHGTATPLGDPIEVEALTLAFRNYTDRRQYCALGSVKGNIGHTDVASGAAGLIKAAKSIEQRLLPASLNFTTPNPKINFADSPLFVNTTPCSFQGDTPIFGMVSSFGVGGTNASLVLRSAPRPQPIGRPEHNVALLSARSEAALERQVAQLKEHVESKSDLDLARMAYTLQKGRRTFGFRRYLPFSNRSDLLEVLAMPVASNSSFCQREGSPLAFMFPGQGNQYVGMGRAQYRRYSVFRKAVDRAAELLSPILELDLRDVLFAKGSELQSAQDLIDKTCVTQPALFVIGYAEAQLWQSWGLKPDVLIGHSVGEYVAACLAGVFTLEQALQLVAARGRLIQSMQSGSMMAVLLPEEQLLLRLPVGIEVAAINSRQMTVVSGPSDQIATFQASLETEKVVVRHLRTSHAFHSAMMEPAIEPFEAVFKDITLRVPTIPIASTLTGAWLTDSEATDPSYWARHMRDAVRFVEAAELLTNSAEPYIFLECGPGHSLASSVKSLLERSQHNRVICAQRGAHDEDGDTDATMRAVGGLWAAGRSIDWDAFYEGSLPGRVPLPGYPFERQSFALKFEKTNPTIVDPRDERKQVGDWFYEPAWVRTSSPAFLRRGDDAPSEQRCWLLFEDSDGVAAALADLLTADGHDIIRVQRGSDFQSSDSRFMLRPGVRQDYDLLLKALITSGLRPTRIVHLWNLEEDEVDELDTVQSLAFYSPLYLEQALIAHGILESMRLLIVTRGVYSVAGEPVLAPLRALAAGPARVIAKEISAIQARLVDIDRGPISHLAEILAAEAEINQDDTVIAYRGNHRFSEQYLPVHLSHRITNPQHIREGGTYLITGGLGALALFFAKEFATMAHVNLVLVHRNAIPDRLEWDAVDVDHEMAQRIAALRELETAGSVVMLAQADVVDVDAMARIVTEAESRFGAIDGVVHSAGIAGGGIIALKSPDMMTLVLAPKVEGTRVLEALFRHRKLDFFLLFSSVTAVLGEAGRVDYCAANSFLDALAQQWSKTRPGVMRSIGWSAWAEIGMASRWEDEKAKRLRSTPSRSSPDTWLQLIGSDGESEIHQVLVDPQRDWIVTEHLVFDVPTLVGTSFVEFVYRYARRINPDAVVEIVNAYFLAPMMVPTKETRQLQLVVTQDSGCRRFVFQSRPIADPVASWQDHFAGELRITSPAIPSVIDLNALRLSMANTNNSPVADFSSRADDGRALLTFSERWGSLITVASSDNEWLSDLQLPLAFVDDFASFAFHPALTDVAFASGRFQMAQAAAVQGLEDGHYLPLGYKRLTLVKPLVSQLSAYVRLIGEHVPGTETIAFDVTILDPAGDTCVELMGYTLKKVDLNSALSRPTPSRTNAVVTKSNPIDEDISRAEGLEAFHRVLSAPFVPHLVVTTKDLSWQIEDGSPTAKAKAVREQLTAAAEERPEPVRTDLMTAFEAPDNQIEKAIAEIWQGILGIREIGVADDFIELGGNSLLAVQMITVTSETFQVDLSIDSFFRGPTIRSLAGEVVNHLIALADPELLDELVSDLQGDHD